MCTGDAWVNGVYGAWWDSAQAHPNRAGHVAMGQAVLNAIRAKGMIE